MVLRNADGASGLRRKWNKPSENRERRYSGQREQPMQRPCGKGEYVVLLELKLDHPRSKKTAVGGG